MGLILIRPKHMASPLEAVPPLNLGHYSDKSLHQGGRMTKFGYSSARSQFWDRLEVREGAWSSFGKETTHLHLWNSRALAWAFVSLHLV